MILKLRDKLLGDHVHVDVFIGPDTEHLAKAGTLVFRVHEWRAFGVMISLGTTPVECPDIREWGRWFEYSNDQRIVGRTEVGDLTISTVFLGLDHNWAFGGPPLLFETMIFRGAKALNYQKRYSTWAEAEEG